MFHGHINKIQNIILYLIIALVFAIAVGAIPLQAAMATAGGPNGNVQPAGAPGSFGNGPTALCANHVWVDPNGGAVKVRGTVDSTAVEYFTPLSKLIFDDGSFSYAFCSDIHRTVGSNERYCLDSSFFTDWRVLWVMNNYPPILTSRTDHAARQAVIWHLVDGFDLNQDDPTTEDNTVDNAVKTAYNDILGAIPTTESPEYMTGDVELVIEPAFDVNLLPIEQNHTFKVRLTKGDKPLPGHTVNVTTDFGSLDKLSAVTNSNGEAQFTVTSSSTGNANLNASSTVVLPSGSRFLHALDPDGKQKLGHGGTEEVNKQAKAVKLWVDKLDFGDLPEGGPLPYNMTTFANDGARHYFQENSIHLGTPDDLESDGWADPSARGDDTHSIADEDGVVRDPASWGFGTGKVIVTVNGPQDGAGCLMGWLDYFNEAGNTLEPDGIFQPSFTYKGNPYSEIIINNQYVTPGVKDFSFTLPPGAASGVFLYARFRIVPYDGISGYDEQTGMCNQPQVGLKGPVIGGEVEDYGWLFGPSAVTLQGFSAETTSSSPTIVLIVLVLSIATLTILWKILSKAQG